MGGLSYANGPTWTEGRGSPFPPLRYSWPPPASRQGGNLHAGGGLPFPFTVVVSVSELFSGVGSGSAASTSAVLERVPVAVGRIWMVTVAEAPVASGPREQVTTPP